jgi:hypothetical protein
MPFGRNVVITTDNVVINVVISDKMTKELDNSILIIARSGQKARGVQHLKNISGIPSFLIQKGYGGH